MPQLLGLAPNEQEDEENMTLRDRLRASWAALRHPALVVIPANAAQGRRIQKGIDMLIDVEFARINIAKAEANVREAEANVREAEDRHRYPYDLCEPEAEVFI